MTKINHTAPYLKLVSRRGPALIFRAFLYMALAFFLADKGAYAQGCSDAGFCTMGAMRPNRAFSTGIKLRLRSVELTQYLGTTKFKDYINSSTADFNFSVGDNTGVQLKLPFFYVNGPLGNTANIGDISLCGTRTLYSNENGSTLSLSIGAKIPTNNSDLKSEDGRPLPMYYQTSLGTYDGVLGLGYATRQWLFATGIQHPFTQNGSQFLWGKWTSSDLNSIAHSYPTSKNLRRGTDVMLRIERNIRFSRLNIFAGLLGIYRLNKDERTNAQTNLREKVAGSDGLAATATAGGGYNFSVRSGIKILAGRQFIARTTNPDGLSRLYVFTLSGEYRF
ncbi:MAG: hypothetical protein V4543_00970 [Bacteroidota bacterium]